MYNIKQPYDFAAVTNYSETSPSSCYFDVSQRKKMTVINTGPSKMSLLVSSIFL
jgi:hypothetical protein